jgi:hypothetical protein
MAPNRYSAGRNEEFYKEEIDGLARTEPGTSREGKRVRRVIATTKALVRARSNNRITVSRGGATRRAGRRDSETARQRDSERR